MPGKLVKTVPLTDDQYDRLWKEKRWRDHAAKALSGVLLDVAEKMAEDEEKMWLAIRDLCEMPDDTDHHFTINWLKRSIEIRHKETNHET